MNRREFIRVATMAAGALTLPTSLVGCGTRPSEDPALPTLGGAPDTDEGRVIAAFCDTVLPGKHRDPKGVLGAIDVGAPAAFFDPELPALPLVPVLVAILEGAADDAFGKGFAALTPSERERALEAALAGTPLLDFALQLVKLATYSTEQMGAALGYPGANAGYVSDPQFSFGVKLTDEITTDGNMP
jgi:hypothetical protein